MLNSQRTFVSAVSRYCADHGIAVEVRSQGWLLVMQRGTERHLALGYDLGLNSSVTHRIANDKAATAEVLEYWGIPCVPHTLFLSPKLSEYVPPTGTWEAMLLHLKENPQGIVVKPNEGTGGNCVFKVLTKPKLELAVSEIFSSNRSLSISPYLEIDAEVRVILVDYVPIVVYSKNRPSIVGDGRRSVLELALATVPVEKLSTVLPDMVGDMDQAALDAIPPSGQRHFLNWRHNLGSGAQPGLLETGAERDACVQIAVEAAKSIELRFGSIDVVQTGGQWKILEINSGVMMEALSKLHPDLVYATYSVALNKIFH
jgi:glutathione synthase/RimK-type ligase-like ATP-grasp enzyme